MFLQYEKELFYLLQLLKIAFDEEVVGDNVETFRKLVNKCRNPASVFQTFAFTGHAISQPTTLHKQKEKNKTLKWVIILKLTIAYTEREILAYQTGFSAVFSIARKSHLTPPWFIKMTLVLWMTSYLMTSEKIYEWKLQLNDIIGPFMNECVNSYATIKI